MESGLDFEVKRRIAGCFKSMPLVDPKLPPVEDGLVHVKLFEFQGVTPEEVEQHTNFYKFFELTRPTGLALLITSYRPKPEDSPDHDTRYYTYMTIDMRNVIGATNQLELKHTENGFEVLAKVKPVSEVGKVIFDQGALAKIAPRIMVKPNGQFMLVCFDLVSE
jgi:hypothetical protein